ncbi:sucrose nonfermenting 4-like protein isoform X1 [Cynara cardunculus var. scolymus]|uniref:sucrose nonfermenting 4-like protein isoform X1 n=3 Tax=Cynara cardunculus var. scolymus TaxID=59895 RepID=UPI000D629B5D|nr:sucrose nonfermenting 4-like protein isoform X1 [Cynara cardunculus var. scolymus]
MYTSGMDYDREIGGGATAAGAGTMLIPTRFVWPYGGRSVYLSGSFSGWSEQWQMTPVEGCPTVFQMICSLPPGYHQYKFIVDGEWRHDEHQPFVTGSYGTVNTVVLAREPDYIPTVLSPQMTCGSSMDVDNEAFQRVVRVSDGILHEPLPKILEADLEVSRHRISAFLSTHMAYEVLPDSGKVIALDVDLPVKQAFHILYEQGITIAPLWDFCKGQFVGVLSALDFILIMRELGSQASNLTEEELETHTISAWKEAKLYLSKQTNERGKAFSKRLVQAGPDENLKNCALKILQHGLATIPIIHPSAEDGACPQLLYLASLSEILKCVCRYFRHSASSLPILQQPICTFPLGTWVPKIGEPNRQPFAMLRPSASLSEALNLFVQARVSSIPIVDENDSLLDVYSRSDITALAKDKVYTHINLEEMTIHQALQLGQEPYSSYGAAGQRCNMCLRSDSLHKVMERMAKPGVRRLVIVEAGSKRVEGIISLSDIFRFLLIS